MTTVSAALKPSLVPSSNHKTFFFITHKICVNPLNFSSRHSQSSTCRPPTIRCIGGDGSSENGNTRILNDALASVMDAKVEELLGREENRVLLQELEKATRRVEIAKQELAEIKRLEIEATVTRDYVNRLEKSASEIAECQRDISEAKAMLEEAEQSLNSGEDMRGVVSKAMTKNDERMESVKAALISAVVGTIAGLPISLARITTIHELILPSAITFVSCALFGVTFRYAVRRDLDNFQLKSGTSAAFGFVKGLATLSDGSALELDDPVNLFSHALYVTENVLVFLFAAIGLDLCFKLRILSPYPVDKSAQE
ncbi:unnamed protein product [Cuscuta epithymum]|uniref:Uncharacterized protein n=1 Tax=Cuscuta epithymum TaxID=186058 RepID=A0AAV0D4I6_9ASTE|nr:unnamed protein product [Cuscuta epithymum]